MDLEQIRMVGRAFYYAVCALALLRGDRPLKLVAAAVLIDSILSPLVQNRGFWGGPQYGVLFLDSLVLFAMAGILLRDRRWWLVAAAACHLIGVLTHIAALVGPPVSPFITATARLLWAYAVVISIGIGLAIREYRRRAGPTPEATVRALVADLGEAKARAELDRRFLSAQNEPERRRATRLLQAAGVISDDEAR